MSPSAPVSCLEASWGLGFVSRSHLPKLSHLPRFSEVVPTANQEEDICSPFSKPDLPARLYLMAPQMEMASERYLTPFLDEFCFFPFCLTGQSNH